MGISSHSDRISKGPWPPTNRPSKYTKRNYGDLLKRGLLHLQLGNYEAAQADASALLKLAPRHPGPNYLQGLLYFQAGRYGDAITNLSLTEPVFAQYPSAEFFLASAHMVGEPGSGCRACRKLSPARSRQHPRPQAAGHYPLATG